MNEVCHTQLPDDSAAAAAAAVCPQASASNKYADCAQSTHAVVLSCQVALRYVRWRILTAV